MRWKLRADLDKLKLIGIEHLDQHNYQEAHCNLNDNGNDLPLLVVGVI
jgi:hypothetical protein